MRKLNGGLMAAITLALLASGFNAEARLGKSGSASRSSGYSLPSRPSGATAPRPYTPPPSRVGGGTSGGMQRSGAMDQARAMRGAPASPAPTGAAAGAAGAAGSSSMIGRNVPPAAPVAPGVAPGAAPGTAAPRGFSTGQMIGGAAAGALGGYVLGRAMAPDAAPPPATTGAAGTSGSPSAPTAGETPAGTTGGAGGAWNAGNTDGTSASAQDARGGVGLPGSPDSSRGGSSMMPFLLLLALLAGAVLYFFKKKLGVLAGANARKLPSSGLGFGQGGSIAPLNNSPEQELLAQAPGIYRRLQDANNAADTAQMRRLVDESYLPVLLDALSNRVEPSRTRVLSLDIKENRVLDFRQEGGKQVGSIYFVARLDEGDGAAGLVEEVWHFVKPNQSADWKLAGIEALT